MQWYVVMFSSIASVVFWLFLLDFATFVELRVACDCASGVEAGRAQTLGGGSLLGLSFPKSISFFSGAPRSKIVFAS